MLYIDYTIKKCIYQSSLNYAISLYLTLIFIYIVNYFLTRGYGIILMLGYKRCYERQTYFTL